MGVSPKTTAFNTDPARNMRPQCVIRLPMCWQDQEPQLHRWSQESSCFQLMVMEKKRMKPQDVNQVYHSNHIIYIILYHYCFHPQCVVLFGTLTCSDMLLLSAKHVVNPKCHQPSILDGWNPIFFLGRIGDGWCFCVHHILDGYCVLPGLVGEILHLWLVNPDSLMIRSCSITICDC